jgi:hypothetical protein
VLQLTPPFVEDCHSAAGAGLPVAPATSTTDWPDWTVALAIGCWAIAGAAPTVRVAMELVAEPTELLKTARSSRPLLALVAVTVTIVVVAVGVATADQLAPPLEEDCHWTLGVGTPLARAVKLTWTPGSTLALAGCVVTTGAAGRLAVCELAAPSSTKATCRFICP